MSMDYFSGHSKIYAEFRPTYPEELYQFLLSHVKGRTRAWDCATGNGQVASDLVRYFGQVDATDISEQQLKNAVEHPGIHYRKCPAETTDFPDNAFDLITVGQAIHWFELDPFYDEVRRVGKDGCILAAWGYNICRISPDINAILDDYYWNIIGSYWPSRRKLVEDELKTIAFPFEEIAAPKFYIEDYWTLDHFIGYITSWSATQNYIKKTGEDPTINIRERLATLWSDEDRRKISFPMFMRAGFVIPKTLYHSRGD